MDWWTVYYIFAIKHTKYKLQMCGLCLSFIPDQLLVEHSVHCPLLADISFLKVTQLSGLHQVFLRTAEKVNQGQSLCSLHCPSGRQSIQKDQAKDFPSSQVLIPIWSWEEQSRKRPAPLKKGDMCWGWQWPKGKLWFITKPPTRESSHKSVPRFFSARGKVSTRGSKVSIAASIWPELCFHHQSPHKRQTLTADWTSRWQKQAGASNWEDDTGWRWGTLWCIGWASWR